jgi:hypothetical protein
MRPIVLFCVFVFVSLASTSICSAQSRWQDGCAVAVRVIDFGGRPMDRIPAQLVNANREVVWEGISVQGNICIEDFPFGVHSLVIEPKSCHPVEISGIALDLNWPPQLFVTVQGCPHPSGSAFCNAVLRVVDWNQSPIVNAKIRFQAGPSAMADKFGRIRLGVPYSSESPATVRVSAPGFEEKDVALDCKKLGVVVQREVVLLRPRE